MKNTSISESTFSKKYNAINYHCVHEAAVAEIMSVGKEDMARNLDDPLRKLNPYSRKEEIL